MLTKMTKVSRAFQAQYGREPSLADLAAELGTDASKISDAYEAVFTHRSLDQPMGDGEGATLGDVLEVNSVGSGMSCVGCLQFGCPAGLK
jgi:DNA-directed RNA polymerase sigma subunit (sigma70/sigma32)